MKNLFSYCLLSATLAASTSVFGHGGHGSENDNNENHLRQRWVCRADATDGSGVFFLGFGRTYGDAYAQAQTICQRARHTCVIECEPQVH